MERITKQRKAILDCLNKAMRPLSVEEILSNVTVSTPSVNRSTIYRNLKVLIEQRAIKFIELPGACIRYEVVDASHRHHFLCTTCNRLYNIFFCPKDISSMVPLGFKMTAHSITIHGICKECAN